MKVIAHPQADGSVAITFSAGEYPIEVVAQRDLPPNTPYLIVEYEALPHDLFFDAWVGDFSSPDGTSIGMLAWEAQMQELVDVALAVESIKAEGRAETTEGAMS